MRTLKVRLSEETFEALDALTKEANVPREELINQVLKETLPHFKAQHLTAFPEEQTLIDIDSGAPTDPSR